METILTEYSSPQPPSAVKTLNFILVSPSGPSVGSSKNKARYPSSSPNLTFAILESSITRFSKPKGPRFPASNKNSIGNHISDGTGDTGM